MKTDLPPPDWAVMAVRAWELSCIPEGLGEARRKSLEELLVWMGTVIVGASVDGARRRFLESVLEAEADIKALGVEAHPAVLMRIDRLVWNIRGEKP